VTSDRLFTVTDRLMFSKSSSRTFETSRLSGGITSSRLRLTASSSWRSTDPRTMSSSFAVSGSLFGSEPGSTTTSRDSELENISLMFSVMSSSDQKFSS
jgi:hypothetical protein